MFDVSWSTPTETVASHRTKKAVKNTSLRSTPGHRSSLISSTSSGSSIKPPSRGISAIGGIFKADRKGKAKHNDQGDDASIASSQPSSSTTETTESSEAQDDDEQDSIHGDRIRRLNLRESTASESYQSSVQSSAASMSSTFSPWSAASSAFSHPIDITAKHEFQPINRHSFVMRSTEVTITANEDDELVKPMQEVHISSDVPNHYLDSDSCTETSPVQKPTQRSSQPTKSRNGTKSKKRPEALRLASPAPGELQTWQPPSNWACPGSPTSTTPSVSRRRAQRPTHLSHQIRRMAAASAKIMLERLTEEWTQVADAAFYKDLMFEKQLWMLTALSFLERGGKPLDLRRVEADDEDDEDLRVLSLFESKASFTHNLTFSTPPALPLHHPIPASTSLPFPAELFDSITSLPLPTLLPAENVPQLLRECHRVLRPGGTLKLFLLDPTPVLGTMGTLLKSWLTKHIMGNIDRRGISREVRKQMSIWLLDAGFMGGDRDIKISFRAAVQDIRPKRKSEGGKAGGKGKTIAARIEAEEEELIVHKLSVTVGRELWKELWGPFVAGHKWWWDDESIVEECKALGTKWEGVFVEAVKRL